jgi:Tol biopolymer transport system component
MLASAAATYLLMSSASSSDERPTFSRFVRLIATAAHEFSPAIAPDGKWVAYLSSARGPTDIWLKSVAGGEPINLTASLDVEVQRQDSIGGLDVSPDGTLLAFAAAASGAGEVATFVIPVPLGGTPRRLFQGRQGMRWSRDGTRIVFVKPGAAFGDSLWVAEADGQNEREIVKQQSARHIHWPRWSADGRHVYFNYGYQGDNGEPTEVFRVPLSGGVPEQVVASARRAVFPLPSPDGRYLFFADNSDGVDTTLWERDIRTGVDRRLTSGIGEFTTSSISADGLRLVATVSDRRQSLVGIQVGQHTPTLEPLTEAYTGDVDPSMSRDGSRIAFSSTRAGSRNLWWARADFSRPVALTTGTSIDEAPVYSPDGSQVAFVSDRGGRRGIWVVSADGGAPRAIATAQVLRSLSWSPDGKRLAYAAPAERLPQVHIVEVETGVVTVLPTDAAANSPVWALGENLIAYIETLPRSPGHVRFMTADGKPVSRGAEDSVTALNNGFLAWAPDGRRLAGVGLPGNRAGSVWILEPDGAVPFRKLVDLPPDAVPRGITWSHDGARVVVGLARATGDIVLAERSR